jgi:pilus assembly protein Flp/PilA
MHTLNLGSNSGKGMKLNQRRTQVLQRLWHEEEGQDLTEYGLLVVLIALAVITAMSTLGNAINIVYSRAAANLSAS